MKGFGGAAYVKEKGNTPIEAQLIAQQLEMAGADAINVSAGMRDSELSFNDHTSGMPRGAWIHLAERIKRVVAIPVIAVKRFSPELAEELAMRGRRVAVITGRDSFVPGMGFTNRGNMFKRFFPKNVTVSNNVKIKKIVPGGLVCEKEGMEFRVCADTIVMSAGMRPRNEVAAMLKDYKGAFLRVGDCQKIGNALKAFHGAYELAGQV